MTIRRRSYGGSIAGVLGLAVLCVTAAAATGRSTIGTGTLVHRSAPSSYVVIPDAPVVTAANQAPRAGSSGRAPSDAWVTAMAGRVGIPPVALRAYARAQLHAPERCAITWTTLAGIGYVESLHGTIGGRSLDAAGYSSSPILGPALDGRGKVAAIRATPLSTQWHGDRLWEHAVGPLQFLPATWATWGVDADRDGVADPGDLDDAALAAADYLCAGDANLATASGWAAAIYSFNHAQSYVDSVYAAAHSYAEASVSRSDP